ncbi:Serine beta-lactamase-like protein LACTB, mitochondrial [Chionoecetes opilio]|uniref:Serine beta-lactamase-like protein LACTB, mitochondrial n=1 Tax=Chionoecetes opilio TaxID=41210 RepID=A0A8J4YFI8_CHIOP|nr:Serine beta-lactamase-like protein LACTB, mitochondrial [Chionoecetes opilio]
MMLQTLLNRGFTKCIPHLHHYSQLTRLSSITVRNGKIYHTHHCACTTPEESLGGKTCSNYSTYNGSSGKQEYKSSAWQNKALGTLVGVLGTVAVLGLGTVLSESLEEKKRFDNETTQSTMKTYLKNDTQVGKDVVGTERKHRNEEAIANPDTRLQEKPNESHEVVQTEKINSLEESVRKSRQILRRHMQEVGAPGMVIAVTVNGKQVWTDGFGFADLENGVRCSPATVMRIASISKSLTMTGVAKLWEDGILDLDAPIQKYIPNFPIKTYDGEEVTITTRHLLSHQSGIRHYKLKNDKENQNKKKGSDQSEGFLYTTHGWTVVSAVLEGAAQKPFTGMVKGLFNILGLDNTYLDEPSPIIRSRASYYIRDKLGRLKNAPYVDNSYKWAGGGFLSTVGDLCKFGNAMLYASQQECREDNEDTPKLPGFLKASTIRQLWTVVDGGYGMGWQATQDKHLYQFCRSSRYHSYHTGGAVGASSILLVLPQKEPSSAIPQGVVVAILTNMQGVRLYKVAYEIAELFEKCQ